MITSKLNLFRVSELARYRRCQFDYIPTVRGFPYWVGNRKGSLTFNGKWFRDRRKVYVRGR